MSCTITSHDSKPFVPIKEDPQVVQEYHQLQLNQPMEQPDQKIVFMLDKGYVRCPVFNITRKEAENIITRHKGFIIFIRIDQAAYHYINDVRIECLKVAWAYEYDTVVTGYVYKQEKDITLDPECGIKPAKILNSLNIEDEYRQPNPYILPYYPIKSYWVGGHGSQIRPSSNEPGYFTVPYNCTIVVKGFSGNVTYSDKSYKDMIALFKMGEETRFPSLMMDDLIKKVGSVAIYGPGDKCPEFRYTLNSNFKDNTRHAYTSGIMDFDCYTNMRDIPLTHNNSIQLNSLMKQNINNKKELKSYYLEQYKWSIYPSQEMISSQLDIILESVDSIEHCEYSIKYMLNSFKVKQSVLCESFPGVYYNFVCRDIEHTYNKMYTVDNPEGYTENTASYRLNNNTIKEIEYRIKNKKPISKNTKAVRNFITEYPKAMNQKTRKQLTDNLIQYLKKETQHLQNVRIPYANELEAIRTGFESMTIERSPNESDEEYQMKVEQIRSTFENLADPILKEIDKIDFVLIRLLSIYKQFEEDAIISNSGMEYLKTYVESYNANKYDANKEYDKKIATIKNFALKNRISEAIGHRRNASRRAFSNNFYRKTISRTRQLEQNAELAKKNKELMNKVIASSKKWEAEERARQHANLEKVQKNRKLNNMLGSLGKRKNYTKKVR